MVAVVTINYNLHIHTIPCINSVLESDFLDLKVFLIDNGSEQEDYNSLVKEFLGNNKVQIFRINKNRGYVGGVNYGLKAAAIEKPDYYMIMNNDTIIDKSAVSELVNAAIRHNNKAIISGKVYYFDHPDILQHTGEIITNYHYNNTIAPGRNEKDTGQFEKELERDVLDDVFWLLPAQVINDVGLYSEYFFLYAEQADYALRARRKGYKLIYTPYAKIWHKESMTSGSGNASALPIWYWRGQGFFLFQYRNLKAKYFIIMMIKCFTKFTVKAVLNKGNNRECAVAQLRGYFWGFRWMLNKKPNNGYNPYIFN